MLWYNLLAAKILLPALNAQGTRRLQTAYPGPGHRLVSNCTNNCEFCAAAYKISWNLRPVPVQTVTLMEVINTDDGSTSTTTVTDGLRPDEIDELSSSLRLVSAGPHTSSVTDLDIIMTYPTPYVVFQDDYVWSGTVLDKSCVISTNLIGEVKAPEPTPLPAPTFSTIVAGVTDTAGWHFDITAVPFNDQLAQYFDDGAINLATTALITEPPPQLTIAFVTACRRSTQGVDGVEKLADCSPVKAPTQAAPTTASGDGGGEGRHTTTDAKGSTIIVAGSAPSGGGSGGRQTITDEHGSTIIVNGGSGGNLYTSINAQGQTIVATGAPAGGGSGGAAGGQITLVNPDGSTVVIQGGSLASPESGGGIRWRNHRDRRARLDNGRAGRADRDAIGQPGRRNNAHCGHNNTDELGPGGHNLRRRQR